MEIAPRRWIALLIDWLKFLVVLGLACGGAAGGFGLYAVMGSDASHSARVAFAVVGAVAGALIVATPYLVVMAVLSLLREIADRGARASA